MMRKACVMGIFAMLIVGTAVGGTFSVAPVFRDGMVLQRGRAVPVWGETEPGATVTVAFAGQTQKATADAAGRWRLALAPLDASAVGRVFTVASAAGETVTFQDVLVGEVWFCSGQSNMQQTMGNLPPEDPQTLDAPLIRQYGNRGVNDRWYPASPATIGDFSATAFHFARRLQESAPKMPIGLIVSASGSTPIEVWMSVSAYETVPGGPARIAAQRATDPELKESASIGSHYERGVAPVIPYGIRGVLWYQGESNQDDAEHYLEKFRALISSWRTAWGREDLPFYYVQLANYKEAFDNPANFVGYDLVRLAQLEALAIPHTGMAVAIDVGDLDSIHPRNKYDIGRRLALWALAKEYGVKNLAFSGPLYRGYKVENGKIRIFFDHVDGGLMVGKKVGREPVVEDKGAKLERFVIIGKDLRWVWADAVIDGDTVVVSSPEVPDPIAVRYAMGKNPLGCNLYNRAGLPASPFRTPDMW